MKIRSILEDVKGVTNVVKVDIYRHDVILSYDETITTVDAIRDALIEAGYHPEGDPEFLR
jgi:copper chaperone CopZ